MLNTNMNTASCLNRAGLGYDRQLNIVHWRKNTCPGAESWRLIPNQGSSRYYGICSFLNTKHEGNQCERKQKKLFSLPFLFRRIRTSNDFSLTFPVCVRFFQEKGKRKVGGGKQLVNFCSTWGEFYPFLYPEYSHKSQTDQSEHSDFMTPYSSSWMQVLFSGDLCQYLHHLTTVGSEVQHSESSTL